MSILDLDVVPNEAVVGLQANTGLFPSPLIASAQTVDRGGLKWVMTYQYSTLWNDEAESIEKRSKLMALVAALRGQANRLRVPVADNPALGNYGGTPLVDGGSQTGNSLLLKGAGSVTRWIAAGDYFSVIVNGEPELKMAIADANSSGGAVTVTFEPRLRAAPADEAAIYVEDGVLSVPKGIFVLTDSETSWTSRQGKGSKLSALSLSMVEDVFATQA